MMSSTSQSRLSSLICLCASEGTLGESARILALAAFVLRLHILCVVPCLVSFHFLLARMADCEAPWAALVGKAREEWEVLCWDSLEMDERVMETRLNIIHYVW